MRGIPPFHINETTTCIPTWTEKQTKIQVSYIFRLSHFTMYFPEIYKPQLYLVGYLPITFKTYIDIQSPNFVSFTSLQNIKNAVQSKLSGYRVHINGKALPLLFVFKS